MPVVPTAWENLDHGGLIIEMVITCAVGSVVGAALGSRSSSRRCAGADAWDVGPWSVDHPDGGDRGEAPTDRGSGGVSVLSFELGVVADAWEQCSVPWLVLGLISHTLGSVASRSWSRNCEIALVRALGVVPVPTHGMCHGRFDHRDW